MQNNHQIWTELPNLCWQWRDVSAGTQGTLGSTYRARAPGDTLLAAWVTGGVLLLHLHCNLSKSEPGKILLYPHEPLNYSKSHTSELPPYLTVEGEKKKKKRNRKEHQAEPQLFWKLLQSPWVQLPQKSHIFDSHLTHALAFQDLAFLRVSAHSSDTRNN